MRPNPASLPGSIGDTRLFERLKLLELVARRNVASLMTGDWRTSITGGGLILHEHRKYVAGQPARHIDWNITARLDEPYVKVYQEERQREVVVALDVSPSMHCGFGERTKLEAAVELAATLALAAIDAGDRLGHLIFADRVLAHRRPASGRRQLFEVLRALLASTAPWERVVAGSDPRRAIHALEGASARRTVLFLISDFLDHDVPDDLRYLRPRHDVSLLMIHDPLEYTPAPSLRFAARSPEGAGGWSYFSPDGGGGIEAALAALTAAAAPLGIDTLACSTAEPAARALGRLFASKRRRRSPAR